MGNHTVYSLDGRQEPYPAGLYGRLPLVILIIGVLFSLFLQTLIRDEVFFAGDMGLKLLQTRQFMAGRFALDLGLTAPPWVKTLWTQGLYPFAPPFVYKLGASYFVQYPPYFPLISALPYAWLGFRGLYLIPLVSTWVVWVLCLLTCRRTGLDWKGQALALTSLIFCSPLTAYSTMFWEHATAVALAFSGLYLILVGFKEGLTRFKAISAGLLLSLSAWFRPECLCLIALVGMFLPLLPRLRLTLNHRLTLACSMAAGTLLFFGLNTVFFGYPLGVHGLQITQGINPWGERYEFTLRGQVVNAVRLGGNMLGLLFEYFPLAFVPPVLAVLYWRKNGSRWPKEAVFLLLLILGLLLTVPLILPLGVWEQKQWGPRFLLTIVPLTALLAGQSIQPLLLRRDFRRRIGLGCLVSSLCYGLALNTGGLAISLDRDYTTRILPTARLLRESPQSVVAVGQQYIAQELSTLAGEKFFFLTQDLPALGRLATALQSQGIGQFFYLRHIDFPAYVPAPDGEPSILTCGEKIVRVRFADWGRSSHYQIYLATTEDMPELGQ